jgi:hypothetical protein
MTTWPPSLADLKAELNIPDGDTSQDINLSTDLASAVAYVHRVRPDVNYTNDITNCLPGPTDDLWAGTLGYARRLFTRRRSPDGVVDMGDLGTGRVPMTDVDIDKALSVGRFAEGYFA